MNAKYKLLPPVEIDVLGEKRMLSQIVALRRVGRYLAGSVGGYVESEFNLDQTDDSWIGEGSIVCGKVRVEGNSHVLHRSIVSGDGKISKTDIVSESTVAGTIELTNSRLRHAMVKDVVLEGAVVDSAKAVNSNIQYSDIRGCNTEVSGSTIESSTVMLGATVSDSQLKDCVVEQTTLSKQSLAGMLCTKKSQTLGLWAKM